MTITAPTTTDATALRDAVTAVRESLTAMLDGFDRAPDAERWAQVAAVGELTRAADTAAIELARRVENAVAADGTPLAPTFGYRNTVEALRHELGYTRRHANDIVTVARATGANVALSGAEIPATYPAVGDAVGDALVSLDQASAIVHGLAAGGDRIEPAEFAAAERFLIDSATGVDPNTPDASPDAPPTPPEQLAAQARVLVAALDPDGPEPRDDQQRASRSFVLGRTRDGMVIGKLRCTPEDGAAIQQLLDAYTSPRRPSFTDTHDSDSAGEPAGEPGEAREHGDTSEAGKHGQAGATGETASATEGDTRDAAERDTRTRQQQQYDALVSILTAHARSGDAPHTGGAAPTLVVTVTADAFQQAAAGDPTATAKATARIESTGDIVPVTVAARMLCDANVQVAVLDQDGHVLRLGRTRRLFTTAQRRALTLRDRGCRGPGCTAPPGWCEAHHIQSWQDGGDTDTGNGIMLCSRCHHDVHRGRLRITRHRNNWHVHHALQRPPRRRYPRGAR